MLKSMVSFTQIITCGKEGFCHHKDRTLKELQLASHNAFKLCSISVQTAVMWCMPLIPSAF